MYGRSLPYGKWIKFHFKFCCSTFSRMVFDSPSLSPRYRNRSKKDLGPQKKLASNAKQFCEAALVKGALWCFPLAYFFLFIFSKKIPEFGMLFFSRIVPILRLILFYIDLKDLTTLAKPRVLEITTRTSFINIMDFS